MDDSPTVAEFVDYCELNAGLLAGRAETIGEEAAALLDDLDEELAAAREGLDEQRSAASTETPPSPDIPANEDREAVDSVADLESELGEKQALVAAKQARMAAFQDLAEAYTDLAGEVAGLDDPSAALERIVEFEKAHDAPTYFDERETLLEAVARESE
ncbi:hypothetical protein [Natronomonas sp. EA1]|uniref:hypothetical protein n=1 Tax=Natronomonas sp. EA1 TaxID=3421655 RepID=UPI003EBE0B1D